MKTYEAMFLFDTGAVKDWPGMEQEIRRLCERVGAELLVCVKFDERKLAYEIKRRKRGTFVLAYFQAPPTKIVDMERDIRLSEVLLRGMVIKIEGLKPERLAELRAHAADQPLVPHSSDQHRREDEYSDDRGPRGGGDRRRRPEVVEEVPAEVAIDAD